ncbi:phasin family protein [Inconstantimicrobium mannanitabidum]|uniref:Uncharacterized protein n=1 Tax=Inconstantimicrobium mannanitabidum TaxID=1604901 RepID=A0ACB5RHX2_9CLOT|nr:hypothetical protein [Clostridium sp. TW13]GKX68674.1 hypothetical protein rsdtw13_39320 [Clostridium sp. TW13]
MINEIKKALLAGVGAVATTYDKAEELVGQFVEKGKLTVEEGKELSEELKRDFDSNTNKTINKLNSKIDEIKPITKDEVREIVEGYSFAYKGEYDILKERIVTLESKVEELEKKLSDRQ